MDNVYLIHLKSLGMVYPNSLAYMMLFIETVPNRGDSADGLGSRVDRPHFRARCFIIIICMWMVEGNPFWMEPVFSKIKRFRKILHESLFAIVVFWCQIKSLMFSQSLFWCQIKSLMFSQSHFQSDMISLIQKCSIMFMRDHCDHPIILLVSWEIGMCDIAWIYYPVRGGINKFLKSSRTKLARIFVLVCNCNT